MHEARIEEKAAQGETDVDPQRAKVVTGKIADAFSGGFQYQDVSVLGDAARYEVTRTETKAAGQVFVSHANSLNGVTTASGMVAQKFYLLLSTRS